MEIETNERISKKNQYKKQCLEMLEYIEKNHHRKTIKINSGTKLVDTDKFILSHRIVIKTWEVFSRTWNTYAQRIKNVYDIIKNNPDENRT